MRRVRPPRALTIAGSDSSGGAGMQADLATFAAHGVHGASVVTAVTAQDGRAVRTIAPMAPRLVRAQLTAVLDGIGVDAVKTGMLATGAVVRAVADVLAAHRVRHLVVDPVLVSSGGTLLLARDAIAVLRRRLLPLAEVVTPNLAEAAALAGRPVGDRASMEAAARAILAMGPRAVVVTGGHLRGAPRDLLVTARGARDLGGRRVRGVAPHGTGCTFAAALAAELARGRALASAVARAKRYTAACIARAWRARGGGVFVAHPVRGAR